MTENSCATSNLQQCQSAFTRIELLVVAATMAVLAALLLPALAATRSDTQSLQCRNDHRQLVQAWNLYADDNRDRTINNFGLSETFPEIANATYRNWVNDVMSWQVTGSGTWNTNVLLLSSGIFWGYTGSNIGVYKCPADTYLSPLQSAAGWTARLRSCSMNGYLGPYNPTWTAEKNNFYPNYRQFLKRSSVPNPASIFVTLDEHADSINDGYFTLDANPATFNKWNDLPASYHDGAGTFSFVDGHVESHRWFSRVTLLPVMFAPFPSYPFSSDPPYSYQDASWIESRASVKFN